MPKVETDKLHWRALTPPECERLQTLPDGWTQYGEFDHKYTWRGHIKQPTLQDDQVMVYLCSDLAHIRRSIFMTTKLVQYVVVFELLKQKAWSM